MKVMGIKVSSQCVRYAILEKTSSGEVVFCNPDTIWLVSARNLAENSKNVVCFFNEWGRIPPIV